MNQAQTLKPIKTVFRGNRFRSRLEARWAVFFTELGIPYEYEKEGFDLKAVLYLPDFWLPEQDCWVEIKGERPNEDTEEKAELLTQLSGKKVFIFWGAFPRPDEISIWGLEYEKSDSAWLFGSDCYDYHYSWCECSTCHKFGIQFDGRGDRICRHNGDDRGHNANSTRLLKAYLAGSMAHFEKFE